MDGVLRNGCRVKIVKAKYFYSPAGIAGYLMEKSRMRPPLRDVPGKCCWVLWPFGGGILNTEEFLDRLNLQYFPHEDAPYGYKSPNGYWANYDPDAEYAFVDDGVSKQLKLPNPQRRGHRHKMRLPSSHFTPLEEI